VITPQDNNQAPSLINLLSRSFDNYESVVTRYEILLKESSALTALIKDKIEKLATLEQLVSSVEDVDETIKNNLDEYEKFCTQQTQSATDRAEISKKELTAAVKDLTFRLKVILAWLVIGSTIGGIALLYVKYTIDAIKSKPDRAAIPIYEQAQTNNKNQYWVDSTGVKHYIYNESHQQNVQSSGTISGENKQ